MAISITKPTVGGSQDTWGETLNTALDTIVDGVNGASGTVAPDLSTLKINGTDVTATANELNVMDGDTAATSTTVTGSDAIIYNDNGVMKQVTMNDINAFIQSQAGSAGNGTIQITAGNALTGGGSFTTNQANASTITLDHQDTSSQSSVNNSGSTYIQDITLDDYGHVTGITSTDASTNVSGAPSAVGGSRFYSNNNYSISTTATVGSGQTIVAWGEVDTPTASILNGSTTLASGSVVKYTNSGSSFTATLRANHRSGGGSGHFSISYMIF